MSSDHFNTSLCIYLNDINFVFRSQPRAQHNAVDPDVNFLRVASTLRLAVKEDHLLNVITASSQCLAQYLMLLVMFFYRYGTCICVIILYGKYLM